MEHYYTFLIPINFTLNCCRYLVWGYREDNDEVVGFSATQSDEQKWTDPEFYTDKKLVEEFKKYLTEQPKKTKRKKHG